MIKTYVPISSFNKRHSTPGNKRPPWHLTREKSSSWLHYKLTRQTLGRTYPDALLSKIGLVSGIK